MDKAVVDRIVDGDKVVLLVGEEEKEMILSLSQLPEDVKEGSWVRVVFNNEEVITIELDNDETNSRKQRIKSKMELLKQRSKKNR
ncbi:DUF3006 domain-containing protein [Evansella sp. AB-rgal1]|uniref:DUF3006 domain-containing protein n=1 Tax=Evansella sp. AB-rgal1 TaxID=3242696 RepID=UPI00359D3573